MKSFETGLRDDILAANLRPLLRLPELTDEDLMKHVNELACHQAERQNKLACERRARINACDVEESEPKQQKFKEGNKQILAEIREIRYELENLKQHQLKAGGSRVLPDQSRTKSPRYRGRGCQACKEKRLGATSSHCFACGKYGHIASECNKNMAENSGNERRLSRGRDRE
ncbi:Retrovirus-related Pol poly from transposon [Paramuricea clavata]|uniref:Retrovirus-related Pol poly from transposon n=1 Tax=Paramuricea clavata TaxID=317549 RepID=A0A7D9IM26_PARCT|nr:Retrovirus-related Pol poly from transposon [Paramuricea clavata]